MKTARRKRSVNTAWPLCAWNPPWKSLNPHLSKARSCGPEPARVGAVPGTAGSCGSRSQRSAIQHRRPSSPASPAPEGGSGRACRAVRARARLPRGRPQGSAAAALAAAELPAPPARDRPLMLCRGPPQPCPACAGTRHSIAAPGVPQPLARQEEDWECAGIFRLGFAPPPAVVRCQTVSKWQHRLRAGHPPDLPCYRRSWGKLKQEPKMLCRTL